MGGVTRGVVYIKYQNQPCPLCALEYPIGQETEHLICVALGDTTELVQTNAWWMCVWSLNFSTLHACNVLCKSHTAYFFMAKINHRCYL